jgi:hypothetical protein
VGILGVAQSPCDARETKRLPDRLEFLPASEKLSFQDMKSIGRAFKLLLAEDLPRDTRINNIIVAQACRHAVVHAEGVVNGRLLNEIRDADPRTVKQILSLC